MAGAKLSAKAQLLNLVQLDTPRTDGRIFELLFFCIVSNYSYSVWNCVWGTDSAVQRIILRYIFRNCDVGVWTGLSWLRIGTVGWHF
jgi:hypothetical protein